MRVKDDLVTLQNNVMRVVVAPGAGARVVSLMDVRTGREWLAKGAPPLRPGSGASYGLEEAAGWDECFPTVAPCTFGGFALRDHGEVWGRPWDIEASEPLHLATVFRSDAFVFRRVLQLVDTTLIARYRLTNPSPKPLAASWAMHPLFGLKKGETIELDSVSALAPTYLSTQPDASRFTPIPWPAGDARLPFALAEVQGADANFAGKFFAIGVGTHARIGGASEFIDLRWRGINHLGLWLAYGGWPTTNEIVHVAIEPTTSPCDSLAEAMSQYDDLVTLAAFGTREWEVDLTLTSKCNSG